MNHLLRCVALPRAVPPAARKKVERAIEGHLAAVEALTTFLDGLDGDADFEPSLGSHPVHLPTSLVDCEMECEDEGAACDDEGVDTDREPDAGGGSYGA
jgi:hypothetical protein